ncbi:hypothetical protein llap_19683 [Limosa lapponica baueri]|uniref:Uncharacterized protein n=1 Tax=Limosa lapponica baueri TaxID=1758121 RepID=A0A2I0T891_LIMLA|nr:hypothetical protein llap_19683 [Limosa lapponica baueri]
MPVPAAASAGGLAQLGVLGRCHVQPAPAVTAPSPALLVAPVTQVALALGIYVEWLLLEAMPARSCGKVAKPEARSCLLALTGLIFCKLLADIPRTVGTVSLPWELQQEAGGRDYRFWATSRLLCTIALNYKQAKRGSDHTSTYGARIFDRQDPYVLPCKPKALHALENRVLEPSRVL